jgi:hypothetical protein
LTFPNSEEFFRIANLLIEISFQVGIHQFQWPFMHSTYDENNPSLLHGVQHCNPHLLDDGTLISSLKQLKFKKQNAFLVSPLLSWWNSKYGSGPELSAPNQKLIYFWGSFLKDAFLSVVISTLTSWVLDSKYQFPLRGIKAH